MSDKAELKHIDILPNSIDKSYSIRLSWDNDRHQSVDINNLNADDVINAFEKMIFLLEYESDMGEI